MFPGTNSALHTFSKPANQNAVTHYIRVKYYIQDHYKQLGALHIICHEIKPACFYAYFYFRIRMPSFQSKKHTNSVLDVCPFLRCIQTIYFEHSFEQNSLQCVKPQVQTTRAYNCCRINIHNMLLFLKQLLKSIPEPVQHFPKFQKILVDF